MSFNRPWRSQSVSALDDRSSPFANHRSISISYPIPQVPQINILPPTPERSGSLASSYYDVSPPRPRAFSSPLGPIHSNVGQASLVTQALTWIWGSTGSTPAPAVPALYFDDSSSSQSHDTSAAHENVFSIRGTNGSLLSFIGASFFPSSAPSIQEPLSSIVVIPNNSRLDDECSSDGSEYDSDTDETDRESTATRLPEYSAQDIGMPGGFPVPVSFETEKEKKNRIELEFKQFEIQALLDREAVMIWAFENCGL